uniref:Uncharacterized protein n=1 Tax=Calidris pygmaea TaxID=425635 RepID=A0A8C3PI10_9CHAR
MLGAVTSPTSLQTLLHPKLPAQLPAPAEDSDAACVCYRRHLQRCSVPHGVFSVVPHSWPRAFGLSKGSMGACHDDGTTETCSSPSQDVPSDPWPPRRSGQHRAS